MRYYYHITECFTGAQTVGLKRKQKKNRIGIIALIVEWKF